MDDPLLVAFLEGDLLAFEQLVLMHRKSAVLFALRLTRNLSAAEDAVQEAFAWMLTHAGRIEPAYGFRPLLYTLVRRRCMDWFRSLRRVEPLNERLDTQVYAPEAVFTKEDAIALYAAMEDMKPRHARILYLLDIEGFTQKEAADILGMTPGAVKTAHCRAKELLRHRLQKEGTTP